MGYHRLLRHLNYYIVGLVSFILGLVWVPGGKLLAQDNDAELRYHEVRAKAGHFFILEDSSIYISRDTIIYLPDTVDYFQRKKSLKKTQNFYQGVDKKLHKSKFSKLVYKLFFERPKNKRNNGSGISPLSVENSEEPYQEFHGKLIGDIKFKHLEIFSTDLNDTSRHPHSVMKFLNKFHIPTSNKVILNNLLIAPGVQLAPAELADNERLLRQLPFIKDSRIHVIPKDDAPDVDLLVITKDVFPLKFDIIPRGVTSSVIGVSNINLFGLGHQLDNIFIIDDEEPGNFGYDVTYRIPNIRGTFINGELNFANTFRKEGVGIRFLRNFLTPDIRYAGGVEVNNFTRRIPRIFDVATDSIIFVTSISNVQDMWMAKAVKSYANPPLKGVKERVRMTIAGRVFREQYTDRPMVRQDSNQFYHNRSLYLFSFGFSTRKYFKDILITNFGRTEDIPIGSLVQITGGHEMGEFSNRYYAGAQIAKGNFIRHFGYLRVDAKVGGFFKNNSFEKGIFKVDASYFSRLYSIQFFRVRQFINSNFTRGFRRNTEELIDINNDNGLRGANSLLLTGTKRLTFSGETVLFTPLNFAGFRLALFGYVDLGFIESGRRSILAGELYKSYGLGFRLKNDNLAFSVIQIRIGFFSDLPVNASIRNFRFSTKTSLSLDDFDIKKPAVFDFR